MATGITVSASADTLQAFLLEEHGIRGRIIQLDASWRAVLDRHDYPPALRDRMGELMAAAALLNATLDYQGSLSLQLQGSGPIHWIVVECSSNYELRATARWSGAVAPGPLNGQIGQGRLIITITPQQGEERYQAIVAAEGGTLAESLHDYFARSEHLHTRLWLSAGADYAAGLLLQQQPDAAQEADHDAWNRMSHLSGTLSGDELKTCSATEIIKRLFHEEDVRVFEPVPVSFRCSCSRERVVNTLRLLGPGEIKPLLEEHGEVTVHCEFCNQRYSFDPVDIEQIFATDLIEPPSKTQH